MPAAEADPVTGEPVLIVHLGAARGGLCGEPMVQITDENRHLARYLCPGCVAALRRSGG